MSIYIPRLQQNSIDFYPSTATSFSPSLPFEKLGKLRKPPLIKPFFEKNLRSSINFNPFLEYIEQILEQMIPGEILSGFRPEASQEELQRSIQKLHRLLPFLSWSNPEGAPCAIDITLLCTANFTQGVGRYVSDALSRWILPGKIFSLYAVQSLNFHFSEEEKHNFFVHQVVIEVENGNELEIIKKNLHELAKEIRLNILAVKHARSTISLTKLSKEQKEMLVQENIASLLDRPSKEFDHNVFDQMHHLLLKISSEQKLSQVTKSFISFFENHPKFFDRDIFNEVQDFILLFRDRFTAIRTLRHVGRLISFQYLFRKSLQQKALAEPGDRHVLLKIVKAELQEENRKRHALGVLVGISFLKENELFDEEHILSALQACIPGLKKVKDSYVYDRRSQDKIRLYYLEVEKIDGSSFTFKETKPLGQQLLRELKGSFQSLLNPVVMPRNEEEVMRHILLLAQQLKYVHDIPQVVITFDVQRQHELSFTVILLRLRKESDPPLEKLLHQEHSFLKFSDFEIKQVGNLRSKYIKEANVFHATVDKKNFLRKDYTLDLFKARQNVSQELAHLLGDIRDFNGGILFKQQEALSQFRELLTDETNGNELLMENFFYSLTPSLNQSLLCPKLLKSFFLMFEESIKQDFKKNPLHLKFQKERDYLMVMIASPSPDYRDKIVSVLEELKFSPSNLTMTTLEVDEIFSLGYLYRDTSDGKDSALFQESIQKILK